MIALKALQWKERACELFECNFANVQPTLWQPSKPRRQFKLGHHQALEIRYLGM